MQKRNIVFWMAGTLAVINLFGALPLLISASAPAIARALGCPEPNFSSGISQCLVLGIDLGPALGNLLGAGILWFLTIYISVIAFGIWLAVLLILLLTSRSKKSESPPVAIASNARLVMAVLLAGITLLFNLPFYIVTAIRFIRNAGNCGRSSDADCIILGFDWGPALQTTERLFELIGEQVGSGAIAIAGWALLALVLWLTFPLARNGDEGTGPLRRPRVWIIATFAIINLLAALPTLLFEAYRFIIWLGGCEGVTPDSTNQCLMLGVNWQSLLITLYELSLFSSFIVPVAAFATLLWLCVSLLLYRFRDVKTTGSGSAGYSVIGFRMIAALAVISFLISFPSYAFYALILLISLPTYAFNALSSPFSFGYLATYLLYISSAGRSAFLIWIVVAIILYASARRKGPITEV